MCVFSFSFIQINLALDQWMILVAKKYNVLQMMIAFKSFLKLSKKKKKSKVMIIKSRLKMKNDRFVWLLIGSSFIIKYQ